MENIPHTNKRERLLTAIATLSMIGATAVFVAVACVLCSSCASNPHRTGPGGWTVTLGNDNGDGSRDCELRLSPKDRARVRGVAMPSGEGFVLAVTSVDWFNNWQDGWTEAEAAASGSALLEQAPDGRYTAHFTEPLCVESVEHARIRYRDTVISGDRAKDLFSRRIERISAVTAFLASPGAPPMPAGARETAAAFRAAAGPFLFPEIYGYPEGTSASNRTPANRRQAEGIAWDLRYTEQALPDRLHEIRDSGTLYRDWEESSDLFYFLYALEN